jgi:hypothetical protein
MLSRFCPYDPFAVEVFACGLLVGTFLIFAV